MSIQHFNFDDYKKNRDADFHTTPFYFAYGSNLHIQQMADRCKDSKPIGAFTLHDWALVFRGVADVTESKGQVVQGSIYKITESDEDRLDVYEGYPTLYKKAFGKFVLDGVEERFMFYTMTSDYDGTEPPSVGYYETILSGYHHWNLPNKSLTDALLGSYKTSNGRVHTPLAWKRKNYGK